jgi:hypothetical protein
MESWFFSYCFLQKSGNFVNVEKVNTQCQLHYLCSDAARGWAGWTLDNPKFGSSVNPIPTKGGRLCSPHYWLPTRIWKPNSISESCAVWLRYFLVNHTHHEPLKWAGWVGSCYSSIQMSVFLITTKNIFWWSFNQIHTKSMSNISSKIRMWPNLMRLRFFVFVFRLFKLLVLVFVFGLTRGKGLQNTKTVESRNKGLKTQRQ